MPSEGRFIAKKLFKHGGLLLYWGTPPDNLR